MEENKRTSPGPTDPELHERIKKLKINTTLTWDGLPVVNDIDTDKVIEEINLLGNIEKLNSFLELKEGWDGYNAEPISKEVVEKAKEILTQLPYQPKDIFAVATGNIQMEFDKGNNKYLEITVGKNISVYREYNNLSIKNLKNIVRDFINS